MSKNMFSKLKYMLSLTFVSIVSITLVVNIIYAQESSTPSAETIPDASPSATPSPAPPPAPSPAPATFTGEISDVNGDSIINLIDARIIAPPATTNCPVCVDINADSKIDQTDVDLINYHVALGNLNQGTAYFYKSRLDVDNDGTLSANDANIITNYLGQTVTKPAFGLDNPSELTFGYEAGKVLVKYKDQVAISQKGTVTSKYNLIPKRSFDIINANEYEATSTSVESMQKQISQEPEVEKAFKSHVGEWLGPNDPYWLYQWGPRAINIEQTWFLETEGSVNNPVRVVVLDTGLDVTHPDLRRNLSDTRRNAIICCSWDPDWDNVTDVAGHGTMMAGIIGATVNNNIGIAGVAPNVDIVPVKAGDLYITEPLVAEGFWWAMQEPNIKVINMSFGFSYGNQGDYFTRYMLEVARDLYNITLIAAAGNDGRDDCIYPARNPRVVCVGATNPNGDICTISSGKQDADIFAPGEAIVTTTAMNYSPDGITTIGGCYTSPATAFVSGVAALCRTVQPLPATLEIERPDLSCAHFDGQTQPVDSWSTIWNRNCYKWDFDNDGGIDLNEIAQLGWRFGNPAFFSPRFDIEPVGGNGVINLNDILFLIRRSLLLCPPR